MLHPYFYRCPPELQLNLKSPRLKYRISGYAQEDLFTLISWTFGDGDEFISGELLYRERQLIAYGGGSLSLPGDEIKDSMSQNPWERIPSMSNIGLNQITSRRLRENYQEI
jgi:hypothetical protein